MSADALHVRVVKLVLNVDQPEHALQEIRPELRQHVVQVDGAAPVRIVAAQLLEEVLEKLGVLYVHQAVGPDEHVVKGFLGIVQQLSKELWGERTIAS